MADNIIPIPELMQYLGLDGEDAELCAMVDRMRDSAVEYICRATGIRWLERENNRVFREAVEIRVWLQYYGNRDGAKNTAYLEQYLTGLVTTLQLCRHEEAD